MKTYIGSKIIKAEPMSKDAFDIMKGNPVSCEQEDAPGYKVVYPDGYKSWSPQAVFEEAYRPLNEGEAGMVVSSVPDTACCDHPESAASILGLTRGGKTE